MSAAVNPYAAPAARVDDIPAHPEAEAIRRAHISHEASIKAIGFLYYLGAAVVAIAAIGNVVGMIDEESSIGLLAFMFFLVLGQAAAGYAVRALRPWGKIIGCIVSGIGLLAFPIGTIINGYVLYLFLSKKGRTIFSPEYQDVIAKTPHIKYRLSILVWIFLGLIVLLIVAGFAVALFGK